MLGAPARDQRGRAVPQQDRLGGAGRDRPPSGAATTVERAKAAGPMLKQSETRASKAWSGKRPGTAPATPRDVAGDVPPEERVAGGLGEAQARRHQGRPGRAVWPMPMVQMPTLSR